MSYIEAIILGVVQGLTEFIPISSSGHLVLVQHFMSGASNHLFLEYINIGTMLALFIFFRKRILQIIKDVTMRKQYKLAGNILLTSVPAGIVGFTFADFIGTAPFFGSVIVVMITLFIVGVLMVMLERLPKASAVKDGERLPPKRALFIGLAQMMALIPGVSRSGSTIIAGRLSGLNAQAAAEYSFLASLPIMMGVTAKILLEDHTYLAAHFEGLLIGNIAALISGLIAVGFLMRYLANHGLALFGWYRIGLAAVIGVVLLLQ